MIQTEIRKEREPAAVQVAFCTTLEAKQFARAQRITEAGSDLREIQDIGKMTDQELILDVFFSERIPDVRIAKRICLRCPIMDTCLLKALERSESYGVWGGQYFSEGVVTNPKKRGRPCKTPKAEDQLPEVPISLEARNYLEGEKRAA